MKRVLILIVACLFTFQLCGCFLNSEEYVFPNQNESIESVELLFYPLAFKQQSSTRSVTNSADNITASQRQEEYENERLQFCLVRELEKDMIPCFMEQIYGLKMKEFFGDPPSDYGAYVVRIYYENGDVVYVGSWHLELVKAGDEPCGIGIHGVDKNQFEALFFSFAGLTEHQIISQFMPG